MKGPYERLKYELRRLWQCPLCHRREWTTGAETTRFCTCPPAKGEPARSGPARATSMHLIEDGARRIDYSLVVPSSRQNRSNVQVVITPPLAPSPAETVANEPPATAIPQPITESSTAADSIASTSAEAETVKPADPISDAAAAADNPASASE